MPIEVFDEGVEIGNGNSGNSGSSATTLGIGTPPSSGNAGTPPSSGTGSSPLPPPVQAIVDALENQQPKPRRQPRAGEIRTYGTLMYDFWEEGVIDLDQDIFTSVELALRNEPDLVSSVIGASSREAALGILFAISEEALPQSTIMAFLKSASIRGVNTLGENIAAQRVPGEADDRLNFTVGFFDQFQ